MEATATQSNFNTHKRIDGIGVIASVLCAIHCALTPILLIALPAFGKTWSHPATHWGMAIIVIPIAVFMMLKSYQKHGKKKVIYVGVLGVICIVVGAILPYIEASTQTATSSDLVVCESVG